MGILDDISNGLASGGQLTPAGQGLLAAGLGILANNRGLTSGAAAIGLGGQQGLATFQNAQQQQLARQLGEQQLIQAQLQNRMLGGKMDFAGFGSGYQAPLQAPTPTQNPAAPLTGMGATPDSIGAMTQNAAAQIPGLMQAQQQQTQAQNKFSPGGTFNPLGLDEQTARGLFMFDPNYAKDFIAPAFAPTDAQRAARAAGIQMGTPEYQAYMQAAADKQNYIPPVSGRPGGYLAYANGQQEQLPHVPDGFTAVRDQTGRWNIVPVPGAIDAISSSEAAQARGKGQYKLTQVYNPATQQMDYQTETNVADAAVGSGAAGTPGFTPFQNAVQQVESRGNPNAYNPASGAAGSMQTMPGTLRSPGFGVAPASNNSPGEKQRVGADYATAMQARYGNDADAAVAYNWGPQNADKWIAAGRPWNMLPNETKAYVGQVLTQQQNFSQPPRGVFGYPGQQGAPSGAASAPPGYPGAPGGSTPPARSGAFSAGPPLGMQAGAQAGATNLQNELSKKWTSLNDQNTQAATTNSYLQSIKSLAGQAATGAQADRINYANGLLSLAGSERATDMVTANNLLDKYSNQIVARLGQGGLGTDAARAILQSAYPNAHMTPQAINEAADNLIGANQMVQAKTRLLQPYANARDAQSYNNLETRFDQNADPRIFQYANISDPAQRQAFAKKLMQQDPKILDKIRNLQSMGAFQ